MGRVPERPLSYCSGARESDSARRQAADGCQLPAAQVGEPVGEVEDQVAPLIGERHSREPFAIPLFMFDLEIQLSSVDRELVRLDNSNGRVPAASRRRRIVFDEAANAPDVRLR